MVITLTTLIINNIKINNNINTVNDHNINRVNDIYVNNVNNDHNADLVNVTILPMLVM